MTRFPQRIENQMKNLKVKDRLAIKHFHRFLDLKQKVGMPVLMKRKYWQKYVGLSPGQAKKLAEAGEFLNE